MPATSIKSARKKVDRISRLPVDQKSDEAVGKRADKQNPDVVEQRPDEADVNVFRYLVGLICLHYLGRRASAEIA